MTPASGNPVRTWVGGARPRTLVAAVAPVVVGTAVAYHAHAPCYGRAVLALVVALSMQIGVNFANDYSDGVRGTDDVRSGPVRLVAGGLASPTAVKGAAFVSFGVGGGAGLALAILVQPWLIAVGAACIAGAWFYTGGKHPYGYIGLGEVAVFVFFGIVATVGTAYVQQRTVTVLQIAASIPVGLLAVALLVVNNLRDMQTDAGAGKRTLAVRMGDRATRVLYLCCAGLPYVAAGSTATAYSAPWLWITFASLPLALPPVSAVARGAEGRDLIAVLGATARLQGVFCLALAAGFVLSR